MANTIQKAGWLRLVYDDWNLIAELDALNTPSAPSLVRSYVWGLDLSGTMQGAGGVGGLLFVRDAPASICHAVAFDGNGNVAALVNGADGNVSAQYEYGPFGEAARATGPMANLNPVRFSTKYQDDETGLFDYGHRYYDPGTGRWESRDPVDEPGFQASGTAIPPGYGRSPRPRVAETQSEPAALLSPYAFVLNRPADHVDYRGLWVVCCRPGNVEPGDPLLTKLVLTFATHCQLEQFVCPNDGFKYTAYPVTKSTTGKMDNGRCCSQVHNWEIRDCIKKRHPYSAGTGCPGNNCQTSALQGLANCCLTSTWSPSWYAGNPRGEVLRSGNVPSTAGIPIPYTIEFRTFPIYE
jgi:RHS repeat-associated protein